MTEQKIASINVNNDEHLDYQVVIIGAGLSGMYQIKRLADLGVRATVLDTNADLGGTWYNNRYPGARFDSESYTYGYSFSREVLDECRRRPVVAHRAFPSRGSLWTESNARGAVSIKFPKR